MTVVILCGGKGTRLSDETTYKPKPLVEIGGKPILWHIMKSYSYYGINKFVLALGYKGEVIKQYFYNYRITSSDFSLKLDPEGELKYFNRSDENNWVITFVDTGDLYYKGNHGNSGWPYMKTQLPKEKYMEAQTYRNSLRPKYR